MLSGMLVVGSLFVGCNKTNMTAKSISSVNAAPGLEVAYENFCNHIESNPNKSKDKGYSIKARKDTITYTLYYTEEEVMEDINGGFWDTSAVPSINRVAQSQKEVFVNNGYNELNMVVRVCIEDDDNIVLESVNGQVTIDKGVELASKVQ